jgi:hypothetical protein
LYYITRLIAGFSAAALPFVVGQHHQLAIVLSGIIAALTVVDIVYNPKDRSAIYSKGADLIVVAIIQSGGNYERFKPLIDTLLNTDSPISQDVKDLQALQVTLKKFLLDNGS